jgi:hypothetical protein
MASQIQDFRIMRLFAYLPAGIVQSDVKLCEARRRSVNVTIDEYSDPFGL